jgi:hypothetical protein
MRLTAVRSDPGHEKIHAPRWHVGAVICKSALGVQRAVADAGRWATGWSGHGGRKR